MRSLFVKIFLWFWLATTLSGVVLFLIGLATKTGPPAEYRRRAFEQRRRLTGRPWQSMGRPRPRFWRATGRPRSMPTRGASSR